MAGDVVINAYDVVEAHPWPMETPQAKATRRERLIDWSLSAIQPQRLS